ncbi:helix-turn-helix transcriptional regulator [Glutamicibacter halophytocola]|uniref:Helix-turn-helix domain-containing protein n=1 Tax=Glutamicibacter halophytocola TaxID=1933880 RepID=A0AA94XUF8_9MICC|nr:helix-turn-helix domain-containing protein [Glutamicibacter halophytocola]UUX60135.1 helix-turn-helix domain-containing protein [Glutamicibacter halophytocola]
MRVKDPAALRRKRINQRFSQRDLAVLVRRSQATIHQLETGKMKTLTEDLALLISARLFVAWEDLFILEEHELLPKVTHDASTSGNSRVEGKVA